jgi:hypothetical protein
VVRVSISGRDGVAVTAFWADRPGVRVPLAAKAFRAYDAAWASVPVEGDAEGLWLRLGNGPVFVIESAR